MQVKNDATPPTDLDAEPEKQNYAQSFRGDRLDTRPDGLNANIEDEDTLVDEAVEQTFPASDPIAVTRKPADPTT